MHPHLPWEQRVHEPVRPVAHVIGKVPISNVFVYGSYPALYQRIDFESVGRIIDIVFFFVCVGDGSHSVGRFDMPVRRSPTR